MLKENPDVFWKWRDLKEGGKPGKDSGGLEKYIF